MSNKLFKCETFEINLSAPEENNSTPQKYQLMKAGIFGYWAPGDMILTKEVFLSFCDNFKKKVRGTDLAVDYAHNKFNEAAGWIKSLELSEDGTKLFCEIDWTPRAQKMLTDKEYRYISAEFSYGYEDENGVKCGPTLFGAGLTNRPFLINMQPLTELSDQQRKQKMEMELKLKELEGKYNLLSETIKEKNNKISELEKKIELDSKNIVFNEMLNAGKVCEAQRQPWLEGNVVKFAELQQPVKLSAIGHSDNKTPTDSNANLSAEQAEEKLLAMALELQAKEKIPYIDAVKRINKENPELSKKYQSKFE